MSSKQSVMHCQTALVILVKYLKEYDRNFK